MNLVYLAGPITELSFSGATDWRFDAAARLADMGVTALSPLRGKDYLAQELSIADSYAAHVMSTEKAILARDKFDVERCTLMLVNLAGASRVSIGTCVGYGWASAASKPIVTVMEADNPHQHSFVRGLSGWVVPTLEEGLLVAASVLLP